MRVRVRASTEPSAHYSDRGGALAHVPPESAHGSATRANVVSGKVSSMKILKFGIANYRGFRHLSDAEIDPVAADLVLHWLDFSNDIIVIVGENNSGKTSLMAAYRDFRQTAFAPTEQDFHGCNTSRPIVMEIVIQADAGEDLSDDQTGKWFDGNRRARVRKVWADVNHKSTKYCFNPESDEWEKGGFGGFDPILQNRLPEPVHIRPMMTSDEIRAEFQKLFKEIVQKYIASSSNVVAIETALAALVDEIENDQYIHDVAKRVREVATDIFPNLSVQIRNPFSDKGIGPLLDKQTDINLTVSDSPSLTVDRHGQGSQRVFMLSALSVLAGELAALAKKTKGKVAPVDISGGKIIQIEEPELYLSPTAVRRMRNLLYSLASQEGVQVMACTHSPVMVDFSRPKQTVVLVEREDASSKLHQSSNLPLAKDPTDALKLLYQLNPILSEALFARSVVLVEGDTEFAALTRLLATENISTDELDVHIIECGGKGALPVFQRVLREFGKRYLVIHDLDIRYADRATDERRWKENEAIWTEIHSAQSMGVPALGFTFDLDFESAHNYQKTKPYVGKAIKFVEDACSDGSIKGTALFQIVEAIRNWKSPFPDVSAIRAL